MGKFKKKYWTLFIFSNNFRIWEKKSDGYDKTWITFYVTSYRKIDISLNTTSVVVFSVGSDFRSKPAEHDVNLTSFVAEPSHPRLEF